MAKVENQGKPMEYELGLAAIKGLVVGCVSYFAQVLLKSAEGKLTELRSVPRDQVDVDLEELLDDYIPRCLGEEQSLDSLSSTAKIRIIKLSAATCSAYLHLKIRKLSSRHEESDV